MTKIDELTMDRQILEEACDVFSSGVERVWDVWTEGYQAIGEHQVATFHGRFKGETFDDAILAFRKTLQGKSKNLVDIRRRSFWGCRFFDNGPAARESFG